MFQPCSVNNWLPSRFPFCPHVTLSKTCFQTASWNISVENQNQSKNVSVHPLFCAQYLSYLSFRLAEIRCATSCIPMWFLRKNCGDSRISYVKIADQNLERFQDETDHPGLVFPPRTRRSLDALWPPSFPRVPRFLFCFLINKTVIWLHKGMPFNECNEKEALERKTVCVRDGPDAQRLTALRWPRFPFWGLFWNDYNFDGSISFWSDSTLFCFQRLFFPPCFSDDFHRLF